MAGKVMVRKMRMVSTFFRLVVALLGIVYFFRSLFMSSCSVRESVSMNQSVFLVCRNFSDLDLPLEAFSGSQS